MILEYAAYESLLLSALALAAVLFSVLRRGLRELALMASGFLLLAFSKLHLIVREEILLPASYMATASAVLLMGYTLFRIADYIKSVRDLEHSAFYDPLTGAYNRNFIEEYVQEEIRKAKRLKGRFCILLLDLNDFKLVNDRYGHSIGDRVLKMVVRELKESMRDYDLIARWGGDEFLVVLPLERGAEVLDVANRLSSNFRVRYGNLEVTLSVGYACYPNDGDSLERLVSVADDRMYRAKTLLKEARKHGLDNQG
ncbi:MAG TPA: GGDEF domain-containing protein [Aquifex aeolicus]|uniref:diguanylate cyclase n=1 Tax=Aquifex aeolicus TaxID=63363 RepID=A0A7C5L684_AQUAO|nr:GGDEF domain-containing protein [Aquifex aeolicus]